MPSTHLSLHYHLVFSTKNRAPVIDTNWRARLHAYLGGSVRKIGGVAESICGTNDHVHLLVGLRATHRLADVMEDIKSVSSLWVHQEIGTKDFWWQEGYGAFTVSSSQLEKVRTYIEHQEEHHRRKTFQEDYLEFLKSTGVQFNEKYLW